ETSASRSLIAPPAPRGRLRGTGPPWPEASGRSRALATPSSGDLSDQIDLDARTHRDLHNTEGAAGMRALFGEHLAQQIRASVGDEVLFGEIGGAVDEAHHLHDALDLVQVADGRVQRAQQVDGDGTRSF